MSATKSFYVVNVGCLRPHIFLKNYRLLRSYVYPTILGKLSPLYTFMVQCCCSACIHKRQQTSKIRELERGKCNVRTACSLVSTNARIQPSIHLVYAAGATLFVLVWTNQWVNLLLLFLLLPRSCYLLVLSPYSRLIVFLAVPELIY